MARQKNSEGKKQRIVFDTQSQLGDNYAKEKIRASDYVRSLESGLSFGKRNKRWLVILQAYIDDSGTQGREPFFCLGGFISTSDNWARFSDEWQSQLDAKPAIPYFSMHSAFFPEKGPFKGWKQQDIEMRVSEFVKIIKNYAMVRVCTVLRRDDYEQVIRGRLPFPPEIDHPYFLCFWMLVFAVIRFQQYYKWNTQIDFFFDEQGKMGIETVKWHSWIKTVAPKNFKPYIGSPPIFRDDRKFLPLEAADLYAWVVRRYFRDNKVIFMPIRNELESLSDMQSIERLIDAHSLNDLMRYIIKSNKARTPQSISLESGNETRND